MTFSPLPDSKDDPQAIIIWDIRTGQKKRGFHCENASVWPIFKSVFQEFILSMLVDVCLLQTSFGMVIATDRFELLVQDLSSIVRDAVGVCLFHSINFRWNHDGCYFARMSTETLSVYETPVSKDCAVALDV